ncbi:eukaryotic aspartyl protease [Opisthorchis viverrini]|uniref:Eukaryotic aspartyl protease n=1 Tax=Opisthorchis viverrini TaxID=6198 RepID=A0A1S8WUA5_OPIVI|nr:eukaryotic aspartyl protease [Opisthorchis viverrini]
MGVKTYSGRQYVNYRADDSTSKIVGAVICNVVGIDQLDGSHVTDVLRIGEYSLRKFNFQTIVSMKGRPTFLDRFSGKLGLGPTSDVTPANFAHSLLTTFPREPVFTFWFHPDHDGVFRSGLFSFGGIHDYRYEGPLIYLPMMFPNSWTVQATSISVGGHLLCQQACAIQFNTAYPYFYGPKQQIDLVHQLLQAKKNRLSEGEYVLECDYSYPLLKVEFGTLLVQWRMDEIWEKKRDRDTTFCKSGMRSLPLQQGWAFGHKLMYKLFTVFDLNRARMGLALASRP